MSITRQIGIYAAVLLAVGVIVYFAEPKGRSDDDEATPGFDDLKPCSELTSLDSTRSLSLTSDHKARFSDKGGLAVRWQTGTWKLIDDETHLYEIDIAGAASPYVLVSAPEGEGCMLAAGKDAAAVDLTKSWFSILADPK